MELPEIDTAVLALCSTVNGKTESHKIRRIKTKDTEKGWQWSSINFNTYFTLEVISWEYLTKTENNKIIN